MNRKLILAASILMLLATVAFCIVGVVKTNTKSVYDNFINYGKTTLTAVSAHRDASTGDFFLIYASEDGKFVYQKSCDSSDYDSFLAEETLETQHSRITRYVYTYDVNGVAIEPVFLDSEPSEESIMNTVSSATNMEGLRFFLFSGVLLLAAAYLFYVYLQKRKKSQERRAAKERTKNQA